MTLDVARLQEMRGWTAEAVERLGITIDGDRVVFPVHDQTGYLVGYTRYEPDPARRNGDAPKMRADAGTTRELFPPPETIEDDELVDGVVFLSEGEPDTVRMWSVGLIAVGVPGAQNWRDEWGARFSGRRWTVVVCFDCDQAGRENAARAATALRENGVDVRVLDLDINRDDGFDVTDYLAAATTAESRADAARLLRRIAADLPLYEPSRDASTDPTVTFGEFVASKDEARREPLLTADQGTLAPAGGLVMFAAKTGDGKTTMVVEFTLHASAGIDYLGLSFPRPLNVLVIENEGPREAFREKLEARLKHWKHVAAPRIWDEPDEWGQIRISDKALRTRVREIVEKHHIDLIVSDSLTRFGVRGNGTPEETREFVEWLTELGLGRDLAFMLLHHPRTRVDPGEDELEQIAGAWPPHADLILLLRRLDGDRARLSFPKTRWAKGLRPPSILAFDTSTESFAFVSDDVPVDRDLVAELIVLMADGKWWTITALRKPKPKGVGAAPDAIKLALVGEQFESVTGDEIGKRQDATYYRLRQASRAPRDGRDASPSQAPKAHQASPVFSRKGETLDDDASSSPEGPSRDPVTLAPETLHNDLLGDGEKCRRCGHPLRRGSGNRGDLCGDCALDELGFPDHDEGGEP